MSSDSSQGKVVSVSVGRLSSFSPGLVSVLEPSPQSVEVEGLHRVSVHPFFGFENLVCRDSRLVALRGAYLATLAAFQGCFLRGGRPLDGSTATLVCGRPLDGPTAGEAERPVPAGPSVWGRGRALSAPVMAVLVLT